MFGDFGMCCWARLHNVTDPRFTLRKMSKKNCQWFFSYFKWAPARRFSIWKSTELAVWRQVWFKCCFSLWYWSCLKSITPEGVWQLVRKWGLKNWKNARRSRRLMWKISVACLELERHCKRLKKNPLRLTMSLNLWFKILFHCMVHHVVKKTYQSFLLEPKLCAFGMVIRDWNMQFGAL